MNILYFASLKESLEIPSEYIKLKNRMDVGELRLLLIKKYGNNNFPSNILCAVNKKIANKSLQLKDEDEVAFYPPVTGG
jgi:molybdopterin synthase sulfur carrier subunit